MDRKGWVMRAVEALRLATFKEIQRYLDEEGDPVLEADLDLAGGVADGAIRAFLDLFEENLRAFAAWIGGE